MRPEPHARGTTKFIESEPAAVEGVLRALKRAADDVKAGPKSALAAVSGLHGLVDAAYQNYLSHGGIDLTPQYPAATHTFLRDMSAFLVQQKRLGQPFDFCRLLNLQVLSKVSPQAVSGAPKCN